MLDIINRYLTSLGFKSAQIGDYEDILDALAAGHKVSAIKHLCTVTCNAATHWLQLRPDSAFASYLITNDIGSLKGDVKTLGLKEAKDVVDFIEDNWVVRYAEE